MQNKSKTKFTLTGLGLIAANILLSWICHPEPAFAAYTLSLSTSTNSISLDVSPQGDGTSIETQALTIASNCRSGYDLTIATPEGSNLYAGGDGTSTATFTAVNGTSALNSANNTNKWGYTITSNPTSSSVFLPLSSTASNLKTPSQTASPSSDINDSINVSFGVKVDNSVSPGTYQMASNGAIVYQLTMEPTCLLYTVQYQGNGVDNPNGMGTTDTSTGEKSVKQINIAEDTKITLLAPNFKKTGYAFLGWSTDQNAYTHFTDNDNTNDPIIYGPMEDVVIDPTIMSTANTRNQINMYAVWLPALRTDPNDNTSAPIYMQEWDNSATTLPHDGCSTLTQTVFDDTVTDEKGKITVAKDSVVALTDKRDNEVYAIARLADGNCWMIENLRLEHAGTVGNNINDGNVTNQSLSQGYGGTTGTYGNFVGLANSESANFSNSTTANSIYKSDDSGDTYNESTSTLEDIGTTGNPSYRFPRYNNSNTKSLIDATTYTQDYINASRPSDSGTNYRTSSNLYSYGNYYTWAAAMANTNDNVSATISEKAGTSICPAGWYLPTIGATSKDYNNLWLEYGISENGVKVERMFFFPNNYLRSGYFYNSSVTNRGMDGYYWSRTTDISNKAYVLLLSSSVRYFSIMRYDASPVRCITSPMNVEVTLDSNNGTDSISRLYGVPDSSVSLPSSSKPSASIAQPNYAFVSWNTAPDGSGASYTSSYTIPAGSTGITLYAQWVPQYTITYVNNCMSWASSDANCTQTKSNGISMQKINLNASGNGSGTLGAYNKFTLTSWKIKEWTTNADGTGTAYPVSSTYTVPSGSGAGDGITLYAHWVPVYTVQYDGNGSDNDSTGMGSTDSSTGLKSVRHTNVAEGNSFDLFASNFKRAGYGFVGWSTDANAWNKLTDNDTTNDAKIWGPNEMITAPAYNGTPITTLYAVWAPAETSGGNPVYLQSWTGCSAMTAATYNSATGTLTVAKNSVTALTDQRDNEVYAIAKLADNNCWMIENLRLADTHQESGNTVATTLSTTNTNILSSNNTLPITNIYNADPALATTSNSLSPTTSVAYDATNAPYGWCLSTIPECDQSRLNTTNTTANTTPSKTQNVTTNTHTNFNTTVYAYGNYYNWYSATAGYGTYDKASGATDGDLCPAGWHLPYGGNRTGTKGGNTSGGFYFLSRIMAATSSNMANSKKFRIFPNNFIFSGTIQSVSVSPADLGNHGFYWSSSAHSNSYAYHIYMYPESLGSGGSSSAKYYGGAVRCVTSPAP